MWKNVKRISDQRLSLLIATAILIGTLILFLPIVLFGINQVTGRGETHDTEQEVLRSEKIISNEIDRMDHTLLDWSAWDETYQFAQDINQEYIDSNMADSSVVNLGIDAFLVLNSSNEVVYEKYIDRQLGVEAPIPFDIQTLLKAYPSLQSHADLQSGQKGIAFIPNFPMLVVSRPILTNMKEGPPSGTLIWIRLLDAQLLEEFSQLADRKLAVFAYDMPPEGTMNLPDPTLQKDQIIFHPLNDQTILGYKFLVDLNGQPLFVLQVENPRDLFQLGRSTAIFYTCILLLIGLILFSGTYHFTRAFLRTRKTSRNYLQRFETIVDQSRDAMLLISKEFRILQVNPAARQLLSLPASQGQTGFLNSILTFEPDVDEAGLLKLCQNAATREYHCTRQDGVKLVIELTCSLVDDLGTQIFSLMLRDITDRKQAETGLRISEERYMLAANGSNDGLWDWNLTSGTVYYSARWKSMLGYVEQEINPLPEEWFERVHPEDLVQLQTQLSSHLSNRTENFQCEYRISRKDGQYHWMLARGVAVWDPAGFARRIAGSQTDIHDRKKLEEQLRHDALHDALTGLGNRTLLIDHLRHVNERKKRKPELLFALFFLDFDRFKQINDTLGHQAGDQLLIEAGKRLGDGLRSADTISRFTGPETLARIAGDEFVLLLEDFRTIDDVQKVVERMTALVNAPYRIADQEITLTASIGLVVPEEAYENPEDIIRDADIAMYRAKQLGGAQVIRFSQEMYQGTRARMQLENDLRKAVEHHEFEVFYQPIYLLDNNYIAGFEALVRWNHPQRGLLLPGEFIKIAEEIGMIVPIGLFVLEEACLRMQSWRNALKISPELIISVNFSAQQIVAVDLLDNIHRILENTGFDPRKLWLEVTEDTLLENNEVVLNRLKQLRALGIRIEIDDFGTGYSSLSYLQNLPIDGFKIDRSFIKDIHGGGEKIVKTLIELGHSLGLTEVAEGVETERQKEYLKNLSCQYAQGFLMSRPISASAIEELLTTMNEIPMQPR